MSELQATVIAVDDIHVCIFCPICGRIHKHGSNGDINRQEYGHRMAHCSDIDLPYVNGFFNTNPRDDSYNLVCTPSTIRDGDAGMHAGRWYREKAAKRFKEARRELAVEVKRAALAERSWPTRISDLRLSDHVRFALLSRSLTERMGLHP